MFYIRRYVFKHLGLIGSKNVHIFNVPVLFKGSFKTFLLYFYILPFSVISLLLITLNILVTT